ncbi:hypothetical protein DPMN_194908 [Dreissena polymorpha]|uniref:Uncharacterized protein n=1 Tax=Dreissena polymorpha TaxID=45954 RepID=A0A9D3Y2Y4_DREPO|nr:hypothetical protein DPMN_194908 [Dreissena polymorpha]
MNLRTKFHQDLTINVASIVLTRKNAPPLDSLVFQANVTIFKLIQDIIETNLLTKFHEDWTINLAHIVRTTHDGRGITGTIFELFHKDRTINVASRVLTSHVFQVNVTIFELIQDIIETNLLTKFHENWTLNVASRVLTRPMLTTHDGQKAITNAHHEHIVLSFDINFIVLKVNLLENAPPLGSHVFQVNVTIFELIQDIIETNLLTKFHEDWTINAASRVLTRQMLTLHDGRRTTDKRRSQKLTMSTLCSGDNKEVKLQLLDQYGILIIYN